MNETTTELEKWLSGGSFLASGGVNHDTWDPGFEVDRQVVVTRMGGIYQNVFLRPDDFVKHFYHEIHPLPIDDWHFQEQMSLYDGFCQIDINLELRFQATLKYLQRNIDHIEDINKHIKQSFNSILTDIVHTHIHNLGDGNWVQEGLSDIEKSISVSINELLIVQNVQPQTICKLNAHFEDFPNIQPGRENVYLQALKKSYEIKEHKSRAFFQQQKIIQEQKLVQKQDQIEQIRQQAEIERQKRAQEAADALLLLKDQEKQLADQLVVEKRIHEENIKHQAQLKEMELKAELLNKEKQLEAELEVEKRIHAQHVDYQNQLKEVEFETELEIKQKQKERKRILESKNLEETLAHQSQLDEKKNQAKLLRREKQQILETQTQQKKTEAEIERFEKQQETWSDAKLRIHEQQIELKRRQKQLEEQAEQQFQQQLNEEKAYEPVMPFQKLRKFEDVVKSRDKAASIRSEIELAVLEKQRLDIELAIQDAQQNGVFQD